MIAFVLANWRWLLPTILAAGLAIDDGLHRVWLAQEQAARARDIAEADEAALHQIERDKQKRAEVDARYQAEIERLKASNREQAIRKEVGGPLSPARRAYYDGVRRDQATAGGGEAGRGGTGRPKPVP